MNMIQMQAAKQSMSEWLSHPQELGKAPSKIECVGTFDLHEMKYYLFKYKNGMFGKWLLGVCGGFEGDSTEHCGHVFSEMEEYDERTAVEKATEMVEMIRAYWMEEAARAEEREKAARGSFVGFVLLSENRWDKTQLIKNLTEDWDLEVANEESGEDNLIFSIGDAMVSVALMPAPIPNQEAEENAKNNYMWPEAFETAKSHKAHLMVAVLGKDADLYERGKLFVKTVASCCKQDATLGVYASGTVFQPSFYKEFAQMMKEGQMPVYNWIWFQLYQGEKGVCAYTYGMKLFGKDEMEVLDVDAPPAEVQNFLYSIAAYVLEYDVVLKDGETIGFTAEDKHSIVRSEGVSLPGMTLKVSY